jgi:hypothetical protein
MSLLRLGRAWVCSVAHAFASKMSYNFNFPLRASPAPISQ